MAASVVLAGYVGFQYVQKERAVELGEQHATSLGLKNAKVSVHPRPVSPFNWTVFVSDDEAHRYAHVNLVRKEPRRYHRGRLHRANPGPTCRSSRRSGLRGRAASNDQPRSARPGTPKRSRLPLVRRPAGVRRHEQGSTCVWFTDLRFLTPGRERMPFRYRVCRDQPGAAWRLALLKLVTS